MKLLLDSCVGRPAVRFLRENGFDATWTAEWERDPGDREILKSAFQNGAVLVTLDKDFGELAIVYGEEHSGIIRLVDISTAEQGPFCRRILEKHSDDLKRGAIVTAYPDRTRIRLPD
jgi:predicted nuclease of predicted toxin-antitoxin system